MSKSKTKDMDVEIQDSMQENENAPTFSFQVVEDWTPSRIVVTERGELFMKAVIDQMAKMDKPRQSFFISELQLKNEAGFPHCAAAMVGIRKHVESLTTKKFATQFKFFVRKDANKKAIGLQIFKRI